MDVEFATLTIGASAVQLSTLLTSTGKLCSKILLQVAPGATGNVKLGGIPGVTSDTTTPGIFLAPSAVVNPDASAAPGGSTAIESQDGRDTINAAHYYVHGTHAGDKVMVAFHRNTVIS